MKLGSLLLRTTVGPIFIGHGAQKLLGVQGGAGLPGTAKMFDSMGLKPGIVHATAAGLAETAGGAGLLLGYRTQLSASAVVATMVTAIHRVHGKNGWNIQAGGYEYNAVLIAAALTVADAGPGPISLDALFGRQKSGLIWGLVAAGLGVAGAAGANAAADFAAGPPAGAASSSQVNPTPEPVQAPAPLAGAETADGADTLGEA